MRPILLLLVGLTLALPLTLTGCAKDGVVIKVDGMYRKAFQERDSQQWYYVKNGRKYYLDGTHQEHSTYDRLTTEHQNYLSAE